MTIIWRISRAFKMDYTNVMLTYILYLFLNVLRELCIVKCYCSRGTHNFNYDRTTSSRKFKKILRIKHKPKIFIYFHYDRIFFPTFIFIQWLFDRVKILPLIFCLVLILTWISSHKMTILVYICIYNVDIFFRWCIFL